MEPLYIRDVVDQSPGLKSLAVRVLTILVYTAGWILNIYVGCISMGCISFFKTHHQIHGAHLKLAKLMLAFSILATIITNPIALYYILWRIAASYTITARMAVYLVILFLGIPTLVSEIILFFIYQADWRGIFIRAGWHEQAAYISTFRYMEYTKMVVYYTAVILMAIRLEWIAYFHMKQHHAHEDNEHNTSLRTQNEEGM